MRNALRMTGGMVGAIALAACGGSDGDGGGGASGGSGGGGSVVDDACAVFTPEELSAAFGVTLARTNDTYAELTTRDGLPAVQCKWDQGAGGFDDLSVNLGVQNFSSPESADQTLETSRVNSGAFSSIDVAGIGDEALFGRNTTADATQASLYFRHGGQVYQFGAIRLGGIDHAAIEASLQSAAGAKF
jgi:hypothetical protein